MKKTLVIGNGYDLEHGMKTSYFDFLNFIKNKKYEDYDISQGERFKEIVGSNYFIAYFSTVTSMSSRWVDFEQELKNITECLEGFFTRLPKLEFQMVNEIQIQKLSDYEKIVLTTFHFGEKTRPGGFSVQPSVFSSYFGVNWKEIQKQLRLQFDELKEALIIYLKYYIYLLSEEPRRKTLFEDLNPDHIITFNYTDIYSIYGIEKENVQHVHGNVNDSNIILGYEDTDFHNLKWIYLKKYFQRIQYHMSKIDTSYFYEVDGFGQQIKGNTFIYGLSLDKTDEDLIKLLYECSEIITIFCHSQSDYESKVINLIDILGKDEFVTAYDNHKIIFDVKDNAISKKVRKS